MMPGSTLSRVAPLILAAFVLICVLGALWYLMRRFFLHRRLYRIFARALPRTVQKQILRTPLLFKETGHRRTVTCLSCSLQGLGALADAFGDKADAFTKGLEHALATLTEAARTEGGTIIALTADGLTALWNAPLSDDAHATHACAGAHAMTSAMADINAMFAKGWRLNDGALPALRAHIALATGSAVTATLRNQGRIFYGAPGAALTRAQHLQSLCARYGEAVMTDAPTRAAAREDFGFLQIDYYAAADEPPMALYALLGNPALRGAPKTRALMTFHDHIFAALRAREWDKARILIEQARQLSGASSTLYDLHLARIACWKARPPGTDWDGAFRDV